MVVVAVTPLYTRQMTPTVGCSFCWNLTSVGPHGSRPCPVCGALPSKHVQPVVPKEETTEARFERMKGTPLPYQTPPRMAGKAQGRRGKKKLKTRGRR